MICYVGKATKIFIFIVAVIVITGLVVGLGVLRRNIHPKSHKCIGEECSVSDYYPPPPLQIPFPSFPNPNPSDPIVTSYAPPPPPETSLPPPQPETSLSPPLPPETSMSPPIPPETSMPPPQTPDTSLSPPSPPETSLPPPETSLPPPPATAAPPQAVQVSPGPMNSS